MKEGIIKECSCGKAYSLNAWRRLHLVGYQQHDFGDGDVQVLELRDCEACNSTLAIDVTGEWLLLREARGAVLAFVSREIMGAVRAAKETKVRILHVAVAS